MNAITLLDLQKAIESKKQPRSAWNKGVKEYALFLIENRDDILTCPIKTTSDLEFLLLNGANSWEQFSYDGCAYIYNKDIAKALCTPSELKRTKEGTKAPNTHETWLDVQARALYQAFWLIQRTFCELYYS